jgi:hypothetical protein
MRLLFRLLAVAPQGKDAGVSLPTIVPVRLLLIGRKTLGFPWRQPAVRE